MTAISTNSATSIEEEVRFLMGRLGVANESLSSGDLEARSPINGEVIARVRQTSSGEVDSAISTAQRAYLEWRMVPAPRRGELVRLIGEELRASLPDLGRLVTIEAGKILSEGCGEVQEMIDICGFAAGLSRQLAGLTLPSERHAHRMMETWHPLGVVGVISAF